MSELPLVIDIDNDEDTGPILDIDADFLNDSLIITLAEDEMPHELFDQLLAEDANLAEHELTFIYISLQFVL